jgi:Putative Actinobacterial Holin-X, holin superfamily III
MERDRDLRDAPWSELFKRLSAEVSLLVQQEFQLFRLEMTDKTKDVGKRVAGEAVMLIAAAVCAVAALGAFTAAIILLFALVVPTWAAALIVTAIYGIVAAIMALVAKQQLSKLKPPIPQQTIETIREDVQWAKTRANSERR